jgi:hypothetical protein
MFNLVRRDGARENSGHFESLKHDGTSTYLIGQVVALEGGVAKHVGGATNAKVPYGIVARDEDKSGKEVIVLRITDEMEFETPITGANIAKVTAGFAVAINTTDYGSVASAAATLGADYVGAIVIDTLGAKSAGDKVAVRFKV